MILGYCILAAILILHIFVSVRTIKLINKTIVLSPKQKQAHRILVFLVPFLWAVFLKGALKGNPGSHEAPEEVPINYVSHGQSGESFGDV